MYFVAPPVYVIAFPILLVMAFVCSMLAFERPTETPFTISVIVIVMSCLPVSIPVSIYLMWSRYFRNQLNKSLIFAGLPIYMLVVMFLTCGLLDSLNKIFPFS
jgi:hypothetical protein